MTASNLDLVLAYHQRSKHSHQRYAASLGYMDWATQPDPFRRYEGADILPLGLGQATKEPAFSQILAEGQVPASRLDFASISQLFEDSLALSAWKEAPGARWPLRVNPSSGNLHPTEGYLLAGPIQDLADSPGLYHYSALEHVLERRRQILPALWTELSARLPKDSLLVGLTSIHWREAWKYGERAYRYCQHDAGHALGALVLSAAALGWRARLLQGCSDGELAVLLGIQGQEGVEAEHPDCLLLLQTTAQEPFQELGEVARDFVLPANLLADLEAMPLVGKANSLSQSHHAWPAIDEVTAACLQQERPLLGPPEVTAEEAPSSASRGTEHPARQLIRQRRSAVAMDGHTTMPRDLFYRILQELMPYAGCLPFGSLPWRPRIHLLLFVHRVEGLEPGLYLLQRHGEARLRSRLAADFLWQRPPSCPKGLDLHLLRAGDSQPTARSLSCHQEIAADGCFAVAMLAEFEESLESYGPWFYRCLHWEAGMVGQMLYLSAEAAGLRGTGIGCFFDDETLAILGLRDLKLQDLYHFTVGGPVEDSRLKSLEAYAHLAPSVRRKGV